MKIINAMLGRGQGGIEQAFLDYCDALALAGHEVQALTHPDAAITAELVKRNIPIHTLSNFGAWDPIAIYKLKKLLHRLAPDASIAHGNRAVTLLKRAGARQLIAPLHNYKIKCKNLAAVFCPTKDLLLHAEKQGMPAERIYTISNLVRVPIVAKEREWHEPPVIGSMGRFVAKKGFDLYIAALTLLKSGGIPFRAILAGGGAEADALRALASARGLGEALSFTGWVENTQTFFDSIDLFCLPSHHEPFGIVLLEAMAQKLPVVSTASEGPSEIIEHSINGLIVPKGDAEALAASLALLLKDAVRARELAKHAYDTVRGRYDLPVVSAKLDLALRSICGGNASPISPSG